MEEIRSAETVAARDQDKKMTSKAIKTPKELWEELASYSTLHGFHFTFNKSSTIRRALWVLLMLVAGGFLINQIYAGWKKVIAFQVVLKHKNEFRDSLDFPAVSICNNNMMRRSRINGTLVQRYLDLLDPIKSRKWSGLKNGLNYSMDMKSAVRQYGHNLSEMLLYNECQWPGIPCNAYNFTTFFSFRHGMCYTFNSGNNQNSILKTTKTGSTFGLSMVINSQPEEYYGPYSREGTGFRVIIHDQNEYPSIEERSSLQISPGSSVEMRIKRKELHSLPDPYPKSCRKERGYSQSGCLQKCYTDAILRRCGCQVLGMLHSEPIDLPWCTPWKIRNCFYKTSGIANLKICKCNVRCSRVKYDVQSSYIYFPSMSYWENIVEKENVSSDPQKISEYQAWFRQRYVKLSVFYGELEAEITAEEPAYEFTDLASDLGGSMGLFLGCSVLTVFEFIDVLILICISHWKKRHRTSSMVLKTVEQKAFENHSLE